MVCCFLFEPILNSADTLLASRPRTPHPGCDSLESNFFYSYHFTFPNGFYGIILKIKMHETIFTNTVFNSERRIFYQFFIVIINQIITSIGFDLKIDVKQLVRSWKPPSTKILNWQNIISYGMNYVTQIVLIGGFVVRVMKSLPYIQFSWAYPKLLFFLPLWFLVSFQSNYHLHWIICGL